MHVKLTPEGVQAFVRERERIASGERTPDEVRAKAERVQREALRLPIGNRKRKKLSMAAALFAAAMS